MSWRAFFIGLVAVVLISAITPYNDWHLGNTYITGSHFTPGPFFLLLFLTLGVNLALKLIRRAWALRRAELMLVWCMMIVASAVPSSGLQRFWFSMQAAPAYYADASDLPDQQRLLNAVPESLVLSKDARSVPVRRFFEGRPLGEPVKIYWGRWARSISCWLVFIFLFYLATFFLGGMLRRQWVDVERLIFPLARVPLDVTEGAGGDDLLPELFRRGAFNVGLALTLVFALLRMAPALDGSGTGWQPVFPVQSLLWDTPLAQSVFGSAYIYPIAIGIAFLVPADVALSIWLFFFFTRAELQVSHWMGVPIQGGTYGDWMRWQQAGAFIVFTLMMLWAARRHLLRVACKALRLAPEVDDSDEPISFTVSFWGLLLSIGGMVAWFAVYGMNVLSAIALIGLIFCIALVHARLVAQGGIFFTQQNWFAPQVLHSISGGHAFSGSAAVVAMLQNAILVQDAREILSAHAMNALRITSVFKKHKRWFLPAMLAVLVVAVAVSSYYTMRVYYDIGGLNSRNGYGMVSLPKQTFKVAGSMVVNPVRAADPHFGPFAVGGVIMFVVTAMRAHFYWWPVHSLGFLIGSTWPAHNLWFSFLLAWMIKMGVMKFGGGAMLRQARQFFLGVIVAEAFAIGVSTLLGLFAGLSVGNIFMPV